VYRDVIAVCSDIRIKHGSVPCRHNVKFLNLEPGGT